VVEDEVSAVIERELALLTPEVRGSAHQLEELLDPDFAEIGKSGRLWMRGEMIAALVADTDPEQHTQHQLQRHERQDGRPGLRAPDLRHTGRRTTSAAVPYGASR
jgi:hypothetical protein